MTKLYEYLVGDEEVVSICASSQKEADKEVRQIIKDSAISGGFILVDIKFA